MSAQDLTGVVERMLGHAIAGRWEAMADVLGEDFVIVEPDSLPYGGVHHGVDGYVALLRQIGGLFGFEFEAQGRYALDDKTVLQRMEVTFNARSTGRSVKLPVLEVLRVSGGRVRRSEVFLADTAALLATLGPA